MNSNVLNADDVQYRGSFAGRLMRRLHIPKLGQSASLWLVIALIFVSSRAVSPAFPSVDQAESVMSLGVFLVIVSFGQNLVMQTGGLDLSIPGVIAASTTTLALYTEDGGSVVIGFVIAFAVAGLIGLINGVGVAIMKMPAFITTLAVGTIVDSLMVNATSGRKSPRSPSVLFDLFGGSTNPLGVSLRAWILILAVIIGVVVDQRTTFGRYVRLLGSSAPAARVAGAPTFGVHIFTYVVSALVAASAGMLLLGFSGNATLSLGDDLLLPSIAAVLLGGTVIGSGRGSYAGVAAGAVLLTLVSVVLTAAGYQAGWTQVLFGLVVLTSLLATSKGSETRRRFQRKQTANHTKADT